MVTSANAPCCSFCLRQFAVWLIWDIGQRIIHCLDVEEGISILQSRFKDDYLDTQGFVT